MTSVCNAACKELQVFKKSVFLTSPQTSSKPNKSKSLCFTYISCLYFQFQKNMTYFQLRPEENAGLLPTSVKTDVLTCFFLFLLLCFSSFQFPSALLFLLSKIKIKYFSFSDTNFQSQSLILCKCFNNILDKLKKKATTNYSKSEELRYNKEPISFSLKKYLKEK